MSCAVRLADLLAVSLVICPLILIEAAWNALTRRDPKRYFDE